MPWPTPLFLRLVSKLYSQHPAMIIRLLQKTLCEDELLKKSVVVLEEPQDTPHCLASSPADNTTKSTSITAYINAHPQISSDPGYCWLYNPSEVQYDYRKETEKERERGQHNYRLPTKSTFNWLVTRCRSDTSRVDTCKGKGVTLLVSFSWGDIVAAYFALVVHQNQFWCPGERPGHVKDAGTSS